MDCYENLGIIGEGSYGKVLKCIHKETKHVVAIKKFLDSDEDKVIKKIALREIQMLKKLRHENLVNLLDVFRRKKRLYLVFEFLDRTVLDDLEKNPDGLDDINIKKISFQVLRGLDFCHSHSVIHRDIKPENILISKSGIVKLCDFGFARTLGPGEVFTDYVATRWYRAPELLVGDVSYGKAVDIWAIGCLLFEMATGNPLFPGESDIDQLFRITKKLGNLTDKHKDVFLKNPGFTGISLPNVTTPEMFNGDGLIGNLFDLMMKCLLLDSHSRPSCVDMMNHPYFKEKDFSTMFMEQLKDAVAKETQASLFLKKNKKKTINSIETYRDTKGSKEHPLLKLNYYPYISSSTKKADIFFPAKPNEALSKFTTGDFGLKKTIESEQAELKGRPTFDVTINALGKNLPDLPNNANNRLFANDFQKQVMGNLRKSNMNFEKLHSNFLNKADGFQIEKNMSNDKFVETMSQKKKKKKRKKKESLENANKSIFLPSVIGSNAKSNMNNMVSNMNKVIHLSNASQSSNTDSFTNTGKKETPPGSRRIQSNLPAV